MRILIAEDSLTQAVDLRRRLEAMGHEVVVANDGLKAWKHLQSRPERLVITDWMMPEMSGLDLCRKIRAELSSKYVYTILLTSKSHRHERLQGLSAGADDFLSKPIDSCELEIALKAAQRIIASQDALQARARELEQANQELARLAARDELTGLLNARGFDEALAVAFGGAALDRLPLSLARLELDHVERARAALGPDEWDQRISRMGDLLRAACRECDVPARVGRHGFAVIFPGLGVESALSAAETLRTETARLSTPELCLTASIGVAVMSPLRPLEGPDRLTSLASEALDRARAEGGDRVFLVESATQAPGPVAD
jgi:two-component system chemotaxis response regulator CheY